MASQAQNYNETGKRILDIIEQYRLPVPQGIQDQSALAQSHFLPTIEEFVSKEQPIPLILPAFPFKSPNTVDKVLGIYPDKGEEHALAHLNGLCANIKSVYPSGATLYIVSDGLVYNDLLGISDRQVWTYGEGIRHLTKTKEFTNITFARLQNLLGMADASSPLTQDIYEAKAGQFRDQLVQQNLPPGFNSREEIIGNEDTCATFRGYCKFLLKDLAHSEAFQGLSKSAKKNKSEAIARQMIARGKAFAIAIEKAYPKHVRLSIHPSSGARKFSISLINQPRKFSMTPWHASCRVGLDGSFSLHHREELEASDDLELVYENGRPSYFREKSDLYTWEPDFKVQFSNLYPTGLLIEAENGPEQSFTEVNMQKLRSLAQINSPVVVRGFTDTTDRDMFKKKSREMGELQPWIFGEMLVVRDEGADKGLNNVCSAEPMPFHYDGFFKIKTEVDENGNDKIISLAPRFQLLAGIVPGEKGSGLTLFASSRLMVQNLPADHTLEHLSSLKWSCKTLGFKGMELEHLPLVMEHPVLKTPCIRYHEPWPKEKTAFEPTEVTIENGDQKVCDVINKLLYDHRNCHYYGWVKGDIIINDNFSMMHTRTGYKPGSDREFWRIHVS